MNDADNLAAPSALVSILRETELCGFSMASDPKTGALLRMLAASKPGGAFLELGTGTGLSTAWLLSGMDASSTLLTVDNENGTQAVARQYLDTDPRVRFELGDGGSFLESWHGPQFDFIFADTWPGKYTHLEMALGLLKCGGFYVIDDMLPQPNWPPEHFPKVPALIETLENRPDLILTKMNWATGLIVAVKTAAKQS